MIPGIAALVFVAATNAVADQKPPANAEELKREYAALGRLFANRARAGDMKTAAPLETALMSELQLRSGGGAGAQLMQTMKGKCDTNCKQNNKISDLWANFHEGFKLWEKLLNATENINDNLDENELLLKNHSTELKIAMDRSKAYYETVDDEYSKVIRDRTRDSAANMAQAQVKVDEAYQSTQSFYQYIRPKFVEMRDMAESSKHEIKEYLKVMVNSNKRDMHVVNNNVGKMATRLNESLSSRRGVVDSKLDGKVLIMQQELQAVATVLEKAKDSISLAYGEDPANPDSPPASPSDIDVTNKGMVDIDRHIKLLNNLASTTEQKLAGETDALLGRRISTLEETHAEVETVTKENLEMLYESLVDASKEAAQHAMTLSAENAVGLENGAKKMESAAEQEDTQADVKKEAFLAFLKAQGIDTTEITQMLMAFSQEGQQVLKELKTSESNTGELGAASTQTTKQKWLTDFTQLEATQNQKVQSMAEKIQANLSFIEGMDKDSMATLAGNLEFLDKSSDMNLGAMGAELEKLSENIFDRFEVEANTQQLLQGEFAKLGEVLQMTASERAAVMAAEGQQVDLAAQAAKKQATKMAHALLASLTDETDEVSDEQKSHESHFLQMTGGMLDQFKVYTDGTGAKVGRSLTSIEGGVGKELNKFKLQQDMNNQMQQRGMADVLRANRRLAGIGEEQAKEAFTLVANTEGVDDAVAQERVNLKARLSAKLRAAEEKASADMAAKAQAQHGEIGQAAKAVSADLDDQGGKLTALESYMQKGVGGFITGQQRIDRNLAQLKVAAEHTNQLVSKDFDTARRLMKEQDLTQARDEESLQDMVNERSQALKGLANSQFDRINSTQRDAFEKLQLQRQREIDKIMQGEGTLDDKVKAIQVLELKMAGELNKLEEDFRITESEVAGVADNQNKMIRDVEKAMEEVHTDISMSEVMQQEGSQAQKDMLKYRSKQVLSKIEAATGGLDAKLKDQIRKVQADANDQIHGILQSCGEGGCTEAELQKIADIEAAMKRACSDLAAKQVAQAKGMATFENAEASWQKAVEDQMSTLKGALSESQMTWLKQALETKTHMKTQTDDLTQTVDSLLSLVDSESKAEGEDIELVRAQTKQALQKIKMDLAGNAQKHEAAAHAAMDAAKLAEVQSMQQSKGVAEAVGVAEDELQGAGKAAHDADDELSGELEGERTARQTAVEEQRNLAIDETKGLLGQISEISIGMARRSGKVNDAQRDLSHKLDMISEVLVAEAERDQANSRAQLEKVAAGEDEVQRTANMATKWENDFSSKFTTHESQMVGKLASLEQDATVIATSGMDAVAKSAAAGAGAITREKIHGESEVRGAEAEGAQEVAGELNKTEGYMEGVQDMIAEGLNDEKAEYEAMSNTSSAETRAAMKQDAADHATSLDLAKRVGEMETRQAHSVNLVKGKLEMMAQQGNIDETSAGDAVDALRDQVDRMSFVEARRAEHGSDASLSMLERRVAAQEAETERIEGKNADLKARLATLATEALRRQAIQA
jgi:ElaB/YqjD/DUF883 family membrane-anchored ribosome-binding protein